MNIIELKKHIEDKTLSDSFIILKYEDNTFIAKQYIYEISKFKNKELVYTDSITDVSDSMFGVDDSLYVMFTDTIEKSLSPQLLNNKIIVCKNIDKELINELKDYIVEIPKLQQWQIRAYVAKQLPGLLVEEINWLCDVCKDINRLSNEVDKIRLFQKNQQSQVFRLLNDEDAYFDLSSNTIFNFTNAIIKKDLKTIKEILETIENIDIEPMGVVTILYKSFKNLIDIQMSPNATAESLNMSPKQFNAIRYNCGKFTNAQLIEIFDVITSIDLKLKSGELPNDNIIDYLLTTILK